jgi:hypothetical protein
MRHFKSRFRPRHEERFLCALPNVTVSSICNMVGAFGGLKLDYGKVLRILISRIRKRSTRSTMTHG